MNNQKWLSRSITVAIVLLLAVTIVTIAVGASPSIVFFDDFSDGELENNPTWTHYNNAYSIVNGELHSDGMDVENDGRWRNFFDSFDVSFTANDYVELSYRGLLKSVGNPQDGRGTTLSIIDTTQPNGEGYDLNIQNGYVHGFPTNKYSISLSYRANVWLYDLIVSDFVPVDDTFYEVRAVRQGGIWTLYSDGTLIGTAADPLGLTNFDMVHMPTSGSVIIDDVVVKAIPPITSVEIDIKPGSYPNSINPKSKGKIPVAILTTDTFDAGTVDPDSVYFGETGTEAEAVHSALEDVDNDGDLDMILHFKNQETGIVCGVTIGYLTGETLDGLVIEGSDSIRTVPCK